MAHSEPSSTVETEAVAVARPFRPRASLPLVVLASMAVLAAMYVARDVLVPIAFAILLALFLRPVMRRMRKLHLPDGLSALILITAVVALFVAGLVTLAGQAQTWLAQAPTTLERVSAMLPKRSGPVEDLRQASDAVESMATSDKAEKPVLVTMKSSEGTLTLLGTSSHFVGAAVIVFVLGYFLLAFSDTLLKQTMAAQSSFGNKRNVVAVLQNVERGVSRYLLTITAINIGLGVATGIAMWLLGIPNPVLWGVLATTANYVPHVGAFLCMCVLFFVGAVTHGSLASGAGVAATFAVLTSIESYFLTPMVLSKSLQLSPVAVILAILFWGWLWGVGGGLMAAPLLTLMKIVCDQFDSLHGVAGLLSGAVAETPAKAIAGEDAIAATDGHLLGRD